MASVDPSPFRTSIDDLLVHFRLHCDRTRAALHERDDLWASHNHALRSELNLLQMDERRNREALAERIDVEVGLKEEIRVLVDRIRVLERDRRAADEEKRIGADRVEVLERFWNAEMDRVVEKERAEKRRDEEGKEKRIEEVRRRVRVLEGEVRNKRKRIAQLVKDVERLNREKKAEIGRVMKEKRVMEAGFRKTISEKGTENERMNEKVDVEGLKNRMEAELKKEICELKDRISVSEAEIKRIMKEKMASEEEKRIAVGRVEALERDKGTMEAELKKMKSEKSAKVERIMKEKATIVVKKRRAEECVKEENSKLAGRVVVLKRGKLALEAEVSNKKKMETLEAEKKILEKDKNEKISEMDKRVVVFEREKAETEAEVHREKKDENNESDRIVELNKAVENLMVLERVLEEKTEKDIEIGRVLKEKMALETRNKIVEEVSNKKISELEKRAVALEREKAEKDIKIGRVLKEKMALETRNKILEKENSKKTLEMEARVHRQEKDKNNESDRIVESSKALEIQKRLEEEAEKQVSGFLETIMVLEREKEELEAEVSRMEVLEREKSEAMQRILDRKMAMEAEKDDYAKKNLELADGISILEKEKQRLETEIREKDDAIKVLYKENCLLEDVKKELEVLASKLKEDVQRFQRVHLTDNVGSRSSLWQNEGQNSAGVAYSSEHHGSANDNVENSDGKSEDGMTRTNAGKRKRTIRKCEEPGSKILKPARDHLLTSTGVVDVKPVLVPFDKNTEINSTGLTNGSNGGDVVVACRWEVDQDLLEAFDADPELCLKAVCALYRQHTRLSDSANTSLIPGSRVFKPDYSLQAITLAEYLTTEDPECRRMKKMVGKLNKLDLKAVGVCTDIAKQHYKQVFEIYKKKEDPVFLS